MERIVVIRTVIDGLIERMPSDGKSDNTEIKRYEFIRSYGTATLARFLALKRGLDPELAAIIGHLLDIGRIVHQVDDETQSTIGALEAERILRKTGRFSETEISLICAAIRSQNSTGLKENPYEELLKDSALFEGHLRNFDSKLNEDQQNRLYALLSELGMG
jgi:Predicted HD superfamily hydrolase